MLFNFEAPPLTWTAFIKLLSDSQLKAVFWGYEREIGGAWGCLGGWGSGGGGVGGCLGQKAARRSRRERRQEAISCC